MKSRKTIAYRIVSIVFGAFFISSFLTPAFADETGEMHMDAPVTEKQEQSAKEMKMGESEHKSAIDAARKKYLERMKKIQGTYNTAVAAAKKAKSPKKELAAKKTFIKAKADAQKMYQKERNAAMKKTMKKKM